MTTRDEHLAWCKERALEYCDAGDVRNAYASMTSDLDKHDETRRHSGVELGLMLMLIGELSTPAAMRRFIEGFN
jgi:hypothetical protein